MQCAQLSVSYFNVRGKFACLLMPCRCQKTFRSKNKNYSHFLSLCRITHLKYRAAFLIIPSPTSGFRSLICDDWLEKGILHCVSGVSQIIKFLCAVLAFFAFFGTEKVCAGTRLRQKPNSYLRDVLKTKCNVVVLYPHSVAPLASPESGS